MKRLFFLSILLWNLMIFAQSKVDVSESERAQAELNSEFTNPETSILTPEDFKVFTGLKFYPIDTTFIIKATFVRTPDEKPFLMPTTTDRLPEYVKYGEAHFTLEGKEMVLSLFKNTQPYKEAGYEDYLFLPFTDLTSGDGSYGGGRYLDQKIPEGNTLILDFNKAYNPYCAYNARYSCPIPPPENDLPIRIEAGVKDFRPH
ncbi:DUF1684 domain-containing protein [Aequorivita sp. H23M31]|uniref:DUF1684 domain-containing protein n=1 Tax=Aequorivita ciconiae TaxID=2494375 RepID=A0A410G175_9FLAO|nr:DUF1684 domain-containing protein [Aequorivita sp. H23M31]QAA80980.1 DUF1684 domain-containing protein [Aequorivita sp. H23M31]